MMVFPENFEEKTAFSSIREMLKTLCLSETGRKYCDAISFQTELPEINRLLSETREFHELLSFDEVFPSQDYYNLIPELNRISTPGTHIMAEELALFRLSYKTISEIKKYICSKKNKYPFLNRIAENISVNFTITATLDKLLDDKGNISDHASEELRKIRKDIITSGANATRKIRQILQQMKSESIAADDAEITIRDGRAVIPVPSSNKRKIRGFIHDESASGQTVFIEPAEVFEINNRLRELENAERKEIVKILTHFSESIRPEIPDIKAAYEIMGNIDFIRSKALLAQKTSSVFPNISNTPFFNWKRAVNPVLEMHLSAAGKKTVPLDICVNEKQRILMISGPNAGGKSVCLKTTGLLQYMLQCGMMVPMNADSEAGIFKSLFIEIGDAQSIGNDLSTYSSHLQNMNRILRHADSNSLVLIDEFGSGTDPALGGAIAESMLAKLNSIKVQAVISTHYGNLKEYALTHDGITNCAMLFDQEKMEPLYILSTGSPGSSYAFELASRIGLPDEILQKAISIAGTEKFDIQKQYNNIMALKLELDARQQEIEVADSFLSEMIDKYQQLYEELENQKKNIIKEARNEAIQIIGEANKAIENTIREIKEQQANTEKTKTIREAFKINAQKILSKDNPTKKTKAEKVSVPKPDQNEQKIITSQKPCTGDYVKLTGQSNTGRILSIKNNIAVVEFDQLKISIPVEKLLISSPKEYQSQKTKKQSHTSGIYHSLNDKIADFSPNIDVRGCRAEEALALIEKFIDDAQLLKISELTILHGKGNGILRQFIRQHFSGDSRIASMNDEAADKGGSGITLIKLK